MAPAHVLRLDLAGDQQPVLVAVSPADDADKMLDLELLATDATRAYVMTLTHSRVARYRASKTACSESDWEDALKALLLADSPIGNITATARIADDQEKPTGDARGYMFVDIRKTVPGHRDEALGTLKLRRSNKAEDSVDLFDWCAVAIDTRDKYARDVGKLKREHDALKALVAEETAKIQDLGRSKQDFEATHDSWLKDLLNEKKVKIRTQEQLLATAHVDPQKLAAATSSSSRARPSRSGKRKAETSDACDASNDDPDRMDLDIDDGAESHDEDVDEVDRATTDSGESASDPEPDSKPKKRTSGKKGTRASPASAAGSSGKAPKAGHNNLRNKVVTPDESEDEAPLSRKSPITKKKPAPAPELDPGDVSTASD